jgi:dethiobiotin synthetase
MKYKPIFVTATNTDVGKTYTTCKLIQEYGKMGLKVGVFKPIETGVRDIPLDGELLLKEAKKTNPNLKNFTCNDIVPIQFSLPAAPYIAKKKSSIDVNLLHKTFEKIASLSDVVLIEGAGGLMVPVDEKLYMYDFIKEFDSVVLLVTHGKLGCINDTLLSINLLRALRVPFAWCVNLKEEDVSFNEVSLPFYEDEFGGAVLVQKHMRVLSENLLKLL